MPRVWQYGCWCRVGKSVTGRIAFPKNRYPGVSPPNLTACFLPLRMFQDALGSLWIPMLLLVRLAIQSPVNLDITGSKEKVIAASKAMIRFVVKPSFRPVNFQPDEKCVICLDTMKVKHGLRELPICKHYFHKHCIDRCTQSTCPVCRNPMRDETARPTTTHSISEDDDPFHYEPSVPSSPVSIESSYSEAAASHDGGFPADDPNAYPEAAAPHDGEFPEYDPNAYSEATASHDGGFPPYDETDPRWYDDNQVPVSSPHRPVRHQSPPRQQTTYDDSQAIELGTPSIFPPCETGGYGEHEGPYYGEITHGEPYYEGISHGASNLPPPNWHQPLPVQGPPPTNQLPPPPLLGSFDMQGILRNLPQPAVLPFMFMPPYTQHAPLSYPHPPPNHLPVLLPPPVSGPPPGELIYATPIGDDFYVPPDASNEGGLWNSMTGIFPREYR